MTPHAAALLGHTVAVGLPLVHLTDGWAVVVSSVVWGVSGVAIGYAAHRLPVHRLDHDTALTRLRRFEQGGRWYEHRLHIRAWKDRLPEAGGVFSGGFSKRSLATRRRDVLERFVVETRRAELTHWVVMATGPLHLLWCPLWLGMVMVGFGVVANAPCLLVQRYNRARLQRVLSRREPAVS